MLSVYRGTAYGASNLIVTLIDQGPVEGDYANTATYELTNFVTWPTQLSLVKTSASVYTLAFSATTVDGQNDDGSPKYVNKNVSLKITLDKEGTVVSVEQ